jgi:hypothetical protein
VVYVADCTMLLTALCYCLYDVANCTMLLTALCCWLYDVRKQNFLFMYIKLQDVFLTFYCLRNKKGKGHPCTGTEALYRPYGP